MADTTPCIRCGKSRIVDKTWSERPNGVLITHTSTICPDSQCQKIVEDQLQAQKDKFSDIQQKSLERRRKINHTRRIKK